ncbi:MAG: c-type cytochrome [Ardenticatenaceae bacterium]|nr:c-type cytochrome [Ardenticatenaceae bacterium]
MNRYTFLTFLSLLLLVVALPIYGLQEQQRLTLAQASWQRQLVLDAGELYLENCAACHGPAGQGLGANPPLNTPSLATADFNFLYYRIGHSPHGTAMSIWHLEDGGILNDYQVEALVAFIRAADWQNVAEQAAALHLTFSTPPTTTAETLWVQSGVETDPHHCAACHEEPAVHAERFGLDCARCHTMSAWTPALLVRHVFSLEHGGGGTIACQTCHTETYTQHTCYGCHDHQPAEMPPLHTTVEAADLTNCGACHPTGKENDWLDSPYGQQGVKR